MEDKKVAVRAATRTLLRLLVDDSATQADHEAARAAFDHATEEYLSSVAATHPCGEEINKSPSSTPAGAAAVGTE